MHPTCDRCATHSDIFSCVQFWAAAACVTRSAYFPVRLSDCMLHGNVWCHTAWVKQYTDTCWIVKVVVYSRERLKSPLHISWVKQLLRLNHMHECQISCIIPISFFVCFKFHFSSIVLKNGRRGDSIFRNLKRLMLQCEQSCEIASQIQRIQFSSMLFRFQAISMLTRSMRLLTFRIQKQWSVRIAHSFFSRFYHRINRNARTQ